MPSPPDRPPNPLERFTSGGWIKGVARLALGVALVAAVLHFVGGDSWHHLDDPALLPLVAAGALIHLCQRLARIRKWQLMLAPTSVIKRRYAYLLRIQLIGMVANLVLPVSEAVKVWAVSKNRDDVKVSAKSIVLDMAIHTAQIGLVGVVAGAIAGWFEPAMWAVSITMLVAPLVAIGVLRHYPRPPPESGTISDVAPVVWGLAGVETCCQVGIYAIAFTAIGVHATLLQVLALAPVLYVVDLLNFTPSGLGLREALFAAVMSVLPGATPDIGVAAGLLISSMLLLATLVGGGLALLLPAPQHET